MQIDPNPSGPASAPGQPGAELRALAASIFGRRSIRRYRAEPVPRELIDALLQAARAAPSAHGRQPWRFRVVTDAHEKSALAQSMGTRLRADRLGDGDASEAVEKDVGRSHGRLTGAAALIVVCLSMRDMDRYPDERRRQAEFLMAVQGVAMAGQNLLLAAHAQGLGACWVCAPLFCPEVVRQSLGLPGDWQPQGMVTLGYPGWAGRCCPPDRA